MKVQNNMMKKQKIVAVMVVAMLLNFSLAGVTFADNQLVSPSGEVGLISQCTVTLPPKYTEELQSFLSFLDETFKNKSSDSSLTDIAIQRFTEYKRAIKAIFANLGPQAYALIDGKAGVDVDKTKTISSIAEIDAYSNCQKLTEEYIETGKQQMIDRIKGSATQKSATIMLEKYKAINMKLRELNVEIAKMYAMFMSFANKLPGFLRECVR